MTEGPHAPKYVFVYTYPGYLSTRTYYLKWIEAYRKALIPVYAVCRTKKLKMEKNLFDMDAHGPPFPKNIYFFLVTSQNFFIARVIAFCLAFVTEALTGMLKIIS